MSNNQFSRNRAGARQSAANHCYATTYNIIKHFQRYKSSNLNLLFKANIVNVKYNAILIIIITASDPTKPTNNA